MRFLIAALLVPDGVLVVALEGDVPVSADAFGFESADVISLPWETIVLFFVAVVFEDLEVLNLGGLNDPFALK